MIDGFETRESTDIPVRALVKSAKGNLYKRPGSSVEPYITTIGLYNDDYQLVAIGKLAKPLPNNKDISYTFSVRFDV